MLFLFLLWIKTTFLHNGFHHNSPVKQSLCKRIVSGFTSFHLIPFLQYLVGLFEEHPTGFVRLLCRFHHPIHQVLGPVFCGFLLHPKKYQGELPRSCLRVQPLILKAKYTIKLVVIKDYESAFDAV